MLERIFDRPIPVDIFVQSPYHHRELSNQSAFQEASIIMGGSPFDMVQAYSDLDNNLSRQLASKTWITTTEWVLDPANLLSGELERIFNTTSAVQTVQDHLHPLASGVILGTSILRNDGIVSRREAAGQFTALAATAVGAPSLYNVRYNLPSLEANQNGFTRRSREIVQQTTIQILNLLRAKPLTGHQYIDIDLLRIPDRLSQSAACQLHIIKTLLQDHSDVAKSMRPENRGHQIFSYATNLTTDQLHYFDHGYTAIELTISEGALFTIGAYVHALSRAASAPERETILSNLPLSLFGYSYPLGNLPENFRFQPESVRSPRQIWWQTAFNLLASNDKNNLPTKQLRMIMLKALLLEITTHDSLNQLFQNINFQVGANPFSNRTIFDPNNELELDQIIQANVVTGSRLKFINGAPVITQITGETIQKLSEQISNSLSALILQ